MNLIGQVSILVPSGGNLTVVFQSALKSRDLVRITCVHNIEYGSNYGLEWQNNRRTYHLDTWYYGFDTRASQLAITHR